MNSTNFKIRTFRNRVYWENRYINKENAAENFLKGVKIALNYELYENEWWSFNMWLTSFYEDTKRHYKLRTLCIAYLDDKPIGCSMVTMGGHGGVYIKPKHRYKGYGTKLIRQLRSYHSDMYTTSGIA